MMENMTGFEEDTRPRYEQFLQKLIGRGDLPGMCIIMIVCDINLAVFMILIQ